MDEFRRRYYDKAPHPPCAHTHEQLREALDYAEEVLGWAKAGKPLDPSAVEHAHKLVQQARTDCRLYDDPEEA